MHTTGQPATFERAAALAFELLTAALGQRVRVDGRQLLGERAALLNLHRRGDVSAGGAARLLRAADGWFALNLPRDDDITLLPALVEDSVGSDHWGAVSGWARRLPVAAVVDRAALLGMAAGALAAATPPPSPWRLTRLAGHSRGVRQPLVVNLGQLWAAPLCAHLLHQAGATVVDVESTDRPDGTRLGTPRFYDLLHAGHQRVSLDFSSADGRAALAGLLRDADVVLEASRPRALRSLGLPAEKILADGRARVWVRITGHGQGHNRIAFGDDAAVTGGLVGWDEHGPVFAGDAIADPLTGLASAVAAIGCLGSGGAWIVDVAMSEVAAYSVLPGPTPGRRTAALPRLRQRPR